MSARQRCHETGCRHAPRMHGTRGCALCHCEGWLDVKAHEWRRRVSDAWLTATLTWLTDRETVAIGYPTEMREYEAAHPRPRLADFMHALSPGVAPEKPKACPLCRGAGHLPQQAAS